jgi:uncharacterized membrane protein
VDDGESRCPYCGFDNLLVDGASERAGIDVGSGWVRSFTLFITTVTIDSASESAFVRTKYHLLGYGEEHSYSRTLWLALNILSLILLAIGSALFVVITLSLGGEGGTFGLFTAGIIVLTVVYSLLFYYVTFVPPRR